MKNAKFYAGFFVFLVIAVSGIFFFKSPLATAVQTIKIFIDGQELQSDVSPIIVSDRTMVPIRAICEELGMIVDWDNTNRWVIIESSQAPVNGQPGNGQVDSEITIMGKSTVSSEALRTILRANNPDAPDLVDLYLKIGEEYGIRGDIAFCQAAKETGWWEFGGLVELDQNNYCGLSATGKAAAADEDLRGANPEKVWFVEDKHGAYFDSPATGVEAHIQHLYAYACTQPLPAGKELLSPRFSLVKRGSANLWIDLGGKWACPGYDREKYASYQEAYEKGDTYGHSILNDYYKKVLIKGQASTTNDRITELEIENQLLKMEINALKAQIKS